MIYGLVNLPTEEGTKSVVFDAVYQLCTQNEDNKFRSFQKNIDEVHFDLSQVLLDMQFKTVTVDPRGFQTFWETEYYKPYKKMIIVSTDTYLMKNNTYSFDFNYLYQAQKFDGEYKSPVVL